MNRRQFIGLSGATGLAALTGTATAATSLPGRDYYMLWQVTLQNEDQKKKQDAYLKDVLVPAVNRLGVKPVGVFYPREGISPLYVLFRHQSLESVVSMDSQLASDQEFMAKGAAFINAPAEAPTFKRMESSLLLAFKGMPQVETPISSAGRVFQLRTYESPSVKTGLKKIEMFNDAGEIKIFREVGLNPVFFGQTIVGGKMPNLTYMLVFKSLDEQEAAWKRFGAHPDWKRLKEMPEYSDKAILCGITNLSLVPAEYSQV